MSFVAVVLAHKAPGQVARLVERLAPAPVLLHVDARATPGVWDAMAGARADNLLLLPRHASPWASWGLVEATLKGAGAALELKGWSHLLLLSGQDYPLRSSAAIASFLDDHAASSFLPSWPLPSPLWGPRGGLERISDLNFGVAGRRVRIPWRRRVPAGLKPTGGSMYWALTRPAVQALVAASRERPEWLAFVRGSWIPDELWVPSVLHSVAPAPALINENLTFIRWSNPGAAHPDTLGFDDTEALAAAACGRSDVGGSSRAKLFARKLDAERSPDLLDWIDSELLLAPR